jgi:predicted DNA-binding transcriptional regulator AlpA
MRSRMLLTYKEILRKINKEEVYNHVEPYQFPDAQEVVNGQEFWDEKIIDKWISNYCCIEHETEMYYRKDGVWSF